MFLHTVKRCWPVGSKINQYLMSVLLIFPAFCYGAAIGWMSPMGVKLQSADSPAGEPVSEAVVSWMASIVYIVGTPAVFLFGFVVDYFGRKKALILSSLSMFMCWGLKIYSTETWALITARAIIGFGVGGAYIVTPLYIKEISEPSIRGMLGSLVILSQNLGNLLGYITGAYLDYHTVSWVCGAVPLLHVLLFSVMPETPSFLLKCGKNDEAEEVLCWLRCQTPDEEIIKTELESLMEDVQKNQQSKGWRILKAIFSNKTTFRAFRIIVTVTLARELCGCLAVLHFASVIFQQASAGAGRFILNPNEQAAVLGVVQLLGSCTASSLVERTGRKPLLGGTCFLSGIAMVALSIWFYFHQDISGTTTYIGWPPIVALCVCIFCDASGLQPMPFIIMTEMFSFQLRGTVTSLVMALACILASVQLRLFQPVVDFFGMYMVFCLFATVCLLSTLYIYLYVPETKMKTLEQIYAEIDGVAMMEPIRIDGIEMEASFKKPEKILTAGEIKHPEEWYTKF